MLSILILIIQSKKKKKKSADTKLKRIRRIIKLSFTDIQQAFTFTINFILYTDSTPAEFFSLSIP